MEKKQISFLRQKKGAGECHWGRGYPRPQLASRVKSDFPKANLLH